MKLCHIVSHIDEEASGPSYSVPRLCGALSGQGHDVTLATLDRGGGTRDLGPVRHLAFAQAAFPRKLGRSPAMRSWLQHVREQGMSLIHSHGLWMMPNIYPRNAGLPHVIAPRGTLDPAALVYSRRVKQLVRLFGQEAALREARAFHATSEDEAMHIRAQNLRQPVILSPNGIDIPTAARPPRQTRRTLLYLGRLHAKKGLDMLLDAWAALEPTHPDWDLRIIGKGTQAFEADLAQEVKRLDLLRVSLATPVYGSDKLGAFQRADLFVLPTRGENFGMVVAEALAAGTPVVTTTAAPWQGLQTHRAGWWCAPETTAISASLGQAMAASRESLEAMGARGRAWMRADYGWDAIGASLSQSYHWLLRGGDRPDAVLID